MNAREHSVLIVDDDATWRLLLSLSLRDAGFEVRTSATSADAEKLLELIVPSVLLVDIVQPGEDGLGILEWNAAQHAPVPVLALTAKRSSRLQETLEALRVEVTLYKPIRARDLVDRVAGLCEAA